MKNILKFGFIVLLVLAGQNVFAEGSVNLTIRNSTKIIFEGAVAIPTNIITLTDSEGTPHAVNPDSVLSVMASADLTSSDFSISNLTYYSSFDSLYLKCISSASGDKCDNWQYTVDDSYPFVGMDQNILSGGENVYVYFGQQNKITLSRDQLTTGDTLNVSTFSYDYQNNTWDTRTGVTVGITEADPNNPFSPIEVRTAAVNGSGQATFKAIPAGTYGVGIQEDYYFPLREITVTEGPASSSGSHGGGGSRRSRGEVLAAEIEREIHAKPVFDIEKALGFITKIQKDNGSFGEDMYTDWTTLALAPFNHQSEVIKLIKYFGESELENPRLTDYERRAMALMSLGLNPYNTNGENYIARIVKSFDGKQFGDTHQDNDDIFALIVLQNAGYSTSEPMLKTDVDFILSAQQENGSWDGSVDMTGAAIEALSPWKEEVKVKESFKKARKYLKDTQNKAGGWNNSASSTAWAIEGILGLGEKPENWNNPYNTPLDYFATLQDIDGGVKNEHIQNKLWETAYVVSALSGKSWNQIMQKFEKKSNAPVTPKSLSPKMLAPKI